jgi:hypothetical protein
LIASFTYVLLLSPRRAVLNATASPVASTLGASEGELVASEAECEAALQSLVDAMSTLEPELRRKYVVDRTVSVRVTDLDVTWAAHLTEEGLIGMSTDAPKAQVRLTVTSDDLLALVAGKLAVPTAVATGRVRVQASPFDLLRLSSFL